MHLHTSLDRYLRAKGQEDDVADYDIAGRAYWDMHWVYYNCCPCRPTELEIYLLCLGDSDRSDLIGLVPLSISLLRARKG